MPVSTEERPSRQTVLERAERRERIAEGLFPFYLRVHRERYPGEPVEAVHEAAHDALSAAEVLMFRSRERCEAELEEARA